MACTVKQVVLYEVGGQKRGAERVQRLKDLLSIIGCLQINDNHVQVLSHRAVENFELLLKIVGASWAEPIIERLVEVEIRIRDEPFVFLVGVIELLDNSR